MGFPIQKSAGQWIFAPYRIADIEAAADVYSFASDQLFDLVNAGALQSVDEMDAALETYAGKSVADVKSANASGSVEAATKDGTLYAFPMSADNGYFLYYNSELVTPEDAQAAGIPYLQQLRRLARRLV